MGRRLGHDDRPLRETPMPVPETRQLCGDVVAPDVAQATAAGTAGHARHLAADPGHVGGGSPDATAGRHRGPRPGDMTERRVRVAPAMGRAAIFSTDLDRFHGAPGPPAFPPDRGAARRHGSHDRVPPALLPMVARHG
jgi:hypothetical protein